MKETISSRIQQTDSSLGFAATIPLPDHIVPEPESFRETRSADRDLDRALVPDPEERDLFRLKWNIKKN